MKTTQKERILMMLKAGYEITQLDALREVGCMRLSARINEIKEDHKIRTRTFYYTNGFGERKHIAAYRLATVSKKTVKTYGGFGR